ncbi:MAG: hypothetical protein R3B48_11600 [Kofleriaceae bacterium]
MPSQRLLKILDPLGHIRDLVAPEGATAVVWAPSPSLLTLVKNRLAAAGVHALIATSFRHVASSVMPGAKPLADLAIVDFDTLSDTDMSTLASMRWGGFRGPIVAISASGELAGATRELYQIEAVLPRRRVTAGLNAMLRRLPPRG